MKKVLVIDTSILCVWLGVAGKETCGPAGDRWNKNRVEDLIERERAEGALFVLPLAAILETGNHIAQSNADRHADAKKLGRLMAHTADGTSPWAAFTVQSELWEGEGLKSLAGRWPPLAAQRLTIGDATIHDVATLYARLGHHVEILTGDKGLKALEPPPDRPVPRRRR